MKIIINYGFGNLGSIADMFKKVGIQAVKSSDATVFEQGDKLILPGAPGLLVAPDYETLIYHIKTLFERHKIIDLMPNYEGADFVHTHYAPEIITDGIRGRFRELISRQD